MQCDAVLRARRRKAPAAERRIRPVRGAKREASELGRMPNYRYGRFESARCCAATASQAAGWARLQ